MSPAPFHLARALLLLDPAGAVVWPAERLLAVSDLHLEKGSAGARQGRLLPPWDSRLTLDRLALLLRRWEPRVVVALGDSFHDGEGAERLGTADAARLDAMARVAQFVWVGGNHDPRPPARLRGIGVSEWQLGPLSFRHQATAGASVGEISGHFHPRARVATRAGTIARACFVGDARRLVLPAFGTYTGGLDVGHQAIAELFPRGGRVFLLGRERLFSFALGQTLRSGAASASLT